MFVATENMIFLNFQKAWPGFTSPFFPYSGPFCLVEKAVTKSGGKQTLLWEDK